MKSRKVSELFDIRGKVAIVTGAASGIGRAIALDLAELGASVVIADIALENARKVASEIESRGGKAIVVSTDVTHEKEVEQMVQQVINKFGKVDILVNDAGIMAYQMTQDLSEAELNRTLEVNLKGVVLCSQAVARHMVEQKSGKIVNLGSSNSSRGSVCNLSSGGPAYCASKAAVQAFSRVLAMELAPHGINVNAVAPCPTNTPMHTGYWEAVVAYNQSTIPLGRLAEPEDIAPVVAFLVSDAARFITGQTIHVNGGQIMVD
jgi:NAD(P)-dependent dehydrogenase (short-subunit alcohol dehydrogenase family)